MLTLLTKDIRALFASKKGDGHALRTMLTLICALSFAALEYGIMRLLFSKAQSVISAPITLVTSVLSLISIVMTVIAFARASKLFFDEQDTKQLAIRPVSSALVTFSKIIALTAMHCVTAILFEYPVFLAYISVYNKSVWFYYMAFAYPLLAGLCEIGIALALLYPVRLLWKYVKRKNWVRLTVVGGCVALIVSLCAIIIHKSTAMLSELGFLTFFTDPWVTKVSKLNDFVLPINLLIDYIFKRTNGLYPYIAISVGIFWLGTSFDAFFLHKIRLLSTSLPTKRSEKPCEDIPFWKYILKKEILLRVADSRCSLAFPILLILQPYTLYLAARIANTWLAPDAIISIQSRFVGVAPFIVTLTVTAMTLAIYSLSDTRDLMNRKAAKQFELIHPSHNALLISKTLLPIAASAAFLIISILVLLIFGMLSGLFALFTFLISITSLVTVAMVSWHKVPDPKAERPKSYYTQAVFACSFLILFMLLGALLMLVRCPAWAIYLILTVAFMAIGALPCYKTIKYVKAVRSEKINKGNLV